MSTAMMGGDFPVIYGLVAPAVAVLLAGSMGRYRVDTPDEDISDGTRIRDADTT
ncbi:hypothetical protein [Streptomyces sp. NPDC057889]|uniref:hypothetical protein n=1 Tax=unclassified Streptomyces TaxID=2593676 RepID=UPI00367758A0